MDQQLITVLHPQYLHLKKKYQSYRTGIDDLIYDMYYSYA